MYILVTFGTGLPVPSLMDISATPLYSVTHLRSGQRKQPDQHWTQAYSILHYRSQRGNGQLLVFGSYIGKATEKGYHCI